MQIVPGRPLLIGRVAFREHQKKKGDLATCNLTGLERELVRCESGRALSEVGWIRDTCLLLACGIPVACGWWWSGDVVVLTVGFGLERRVAGAKKRKPGDGLPKAI